MQFTVQQIMQIAEEFEYTTRQRCVLLSDPPTDTLLKNLRPCEQKQFAQNLTHLVLGKTHISDKVLYSKQDIWKLAQASLSEKMLALFAIVTTRERKNILASKGLIIYTAHLPHPHAHETD
jgi:hypothetical protein